MRPGAVIDNYFCYRPNAVIADGDGPSLKLP